MNSGKSFVKTTLRIRQDIFLKVKLLALARGVEITQILNDALEQYVKENESEIKEKLKEVSG